MRFCRCCGRATTTELALNDLLTLASIDRRRGRAIVATDQWAIDLVLTTSPRYEEDDYDDEDAEDDDEDEEEEEDAAPRKYKP